MFRVAIPVSKRYHAQPMTQIDSLKEYQRLVARYAAMEDGELEKVALDFPALTEVAKSVLHSEMSRRDLASPAEIAANHANEIAESEARKPVMIRRYRDLPEASIAKSVLQSAGIDCFLADDNMVRLDWFYSNLVGGIKLLVPEKDAKAALQLLDESTPEKFDVEGVGEYQQPHCPKCGSMDVSLDGLNQPLTFAAMCMTSLPIPVNTPGWKCHSCGHQWNDDGEVASAASNPGETN
jgi:hypothetical protein